MKNFLVVVLLCVTNFGFAQPVPVSKPSQPWKTIPADSIAAYIDSLRTVIINDTAKFKAGDLHQRWEHTRNKQSYSKLFVIDNKYSYLLDIVPGKEVMEFLNEFFIPASIETIIDYTESAGAAAIYGSRADFGAVYIKMKKGVKYNPRVGGVDPNAKPGNL